MSSVIYINGLLLALCYVVFSVDDLVWDLAHLFFGRRSAPGDRLKMKNLDDLPPKLLAVMVAAWHEESVLEPVVDNMIASIQYPGSMFHIFLGVYPNDAETVAVADRLQEKYENVHMVVNDRPGPTCKADNINSIIRYIKRYEAERGWRFASVTVHDSEDVVHPYELKVTNYLIDAYDALQFPVFPLQRMPSLRNFFSGLTSGTYADEFAENHYRTMGMRDNMAALVPSAGTGFVISRRILDAFGNKPLFPEDSLTEDYKLSLTFAQMGYHVHYVLEKVRRVTDGNKTRWDYIATRSIFPATFRTAVRQKTRWIYGITMQSAKFSEIFTPSRLSLAGRYTLYKDLKSKISNLVVLPGYLAFLYAVASLFLKLPVMYPMYSLSWWLCVALTGMMVFRQTLRGLAIRHVYGFRSVLFSCLLPPLMPIRLVWGNIINMSATLRAWKQLLFGVRKGKERRKVAWNKTDHEFIDKSVLVGYQRKLGDVLLEKEFIVPDALKNMLVLARSQNARLGDVLLAHYAVTEEQLCKALAGAQNRLYVGSLSPYGNGLLKGLDWKYLWNTYHCPILRVRDGDVYAVTVFTPAEVLREIGASGGKIVYTTKEEIILFLTRLRPDAPDRQYDRIKNLLRDGAIGWEQAVIALVNRKQTPDILGYMGLAGAEQIFLDTAAII